jgi:ABC-2 type transport system ATP-binding protein
MNSELVIVAKDVKKSYGDVHALSGLNLQVARGECVSLLGPNGAGKTTITEILEGYRVQDSGTVSVLGVDPNHGDLAWRSRLGIVLQSVHDLMELTVLESVRHFAKYYANPADVDEVINSVGLDEKRNALGRHLSGGQRRRLDVALGIIGKPELLFLDEPTTGFDPEARRQFWALIKSLREQGTTILLTTHYLDEAEYLADRVAVISRGRVVADQTPASLRATAASKAVVSWSENGIEKSIETNEPTSTLRELTQKFSGEIPGLSVVRPSLEDVYLELVGADMNGANGS